MLGLRGKTSQTKPFRTAQLKPGLWLQAGRGINRRTYLYDLTNNGAVQDAGGVVGAAAKFENGGYLTHASDSGLSVDGKDFGIHCWAKPSINHDSEAVIAGKDGEWELRVSAAGQFEAQVGTTVLTSTYSAGTGTWHRLAMGVEAGQLFLQVDANAAETVAFSETGFASTGPFQIGGLDTRMWTGFVDEFTYWRDILPDSSDYTWLYNSGNGRTYSTILTDRAILSSGMIGYYDFFRDTDLLGLDAHVIGSDDVETWGDQSLAGRHAYQGTQSAMPHIVQHEGQEPYVHFNGVNDHMIVPWQPEPPFTVACWARFKEVSGNWHFLFEIGNYHNDSRMLAVGVEQDTISFRGSVSREHPIKSNIWYHIAVKSGSGQLTCFIDAEEVNTLTNSVGNTYDMIIGGLWSSGGGHRLNMRGDIRELLLVPQALTDKEIRDHYNHTRPSGGDLMKGVQVASGFEGDQGKPLPNDWHYENGLYVVSGTETISRDTTDFKSTPQSGVVSQPYETTGATDAPSYVSAWVKWDDLSTFPSNAVQWFAGSDKDGGVRVGYSPSRGFIARSTFKQTTEAVFAPEGKWVLVEAWGTEDGVRLVVQGATYSRLLNDIPGAVGAWSLHQLDYNYTGPAVRVRRDNETKDIGFTASGDLDVQALEDFAAGGDVYVERWYDQSGESNDAVQNTASEQPQIVSNGTVITENGKAAIEGDGVVFMQTPVIDPNNTISLFCVVQYQARNAISVSQVDFPNDLRSWFHRSGSSSDGLESAVYKDRENTSQTSVFAGVLSFPEQVVHTTEITPTTLATYKNGNGQEITFSNWDSFGQPIYLFSDPYSQVRGSLKLQEVVLYTSDQSENRTAIEDDINTYYSIY